MLTGIGDPSSGRDSHLPPTQDDDLLGQRSYSPVGVVPRPFPTIALVPGNATDLDSLIPELLDYQQKTDLKTLYTECRSPRASAEIETYYLQWRELSQISTNAFNRLIDGQINRPQGMVIKHTNASRALKAVVTFHDILIEAQLHGLQELALKAHKKVFDYLSLSHILLKLAGERMDEKLLEHKNWFAQAVKSLTNGTSQDTSTTQDNNPTTSSQNDRISTTSRNPKPSIPPPTSASMLKTSPVEKVDDEVHKAVGSMEVAIKESVPQWKGLVNVDGVKIKLPEAILYPMRRPDMYRGIQSNGLLLFGPPGCGKTILVQSLVRESGCNLLNVTLGSLFSKWQGNTEKTVDVLFAKARAIAPCVIFIDEIDAIIRERSDTDTNNVASTKAEFLDIVPNPTNRCTKIGISKMNALQSLERE
ncbi:mitochondrial dynamin GTPase Msp1 [Xanthoria calcicola]